MWLALSLLIALGGRDQKAEEKLRQAKQAYQDALARTGDFDCTAPEFDAVLKMFEDVPRATPARKEAMDVARTIREKRKAAGAHRSAVDSAAAQPVVNAGAGAPVSDAPVKADPASCKEARKRMIGFRVARKKAGKPPLGEVSMLKNGEVGYTPGAEPTEEEASVMKVIKICEGEP